MHAPADPDICLGIRHVQKDGQRTRLQGDCKLPHDLDCIAPHRLAEQSPHQRLDASYDFRQLSAVKKWLGHLAVIGLIRRVHLERQLAHGAHVFFRWDRDTHRSIGTERFPVFGGRAQIFVAQDHGHRVSLELVDEHSVLAADFTEGVGLVVDGTGHGGMNLFAEGNPSEARSRSVRRLLIPCGFPR